MNDYLETFCHGARMEYGVECELKKCPWKRFGRRASAPREGVAGRLHTACLRSAEPSDDQNPTYTWSKLTVLPPQLLVPEL